MSGAHDSPSVRTYEEVDSLRDNVDKLLMFMHRPEPRTPTPANVESISTDPDPVSLEGSFENNFL